ncbi:hypothetical protein JCM30471_34850 [Desulfuromonas carbonis]
MSIQPCVPRIKNNGRHWLPCIALTLLASLTLGLFFPSSSLADQTIIVSLTLNQQIKGDIFVIFRDDGDFLVRAADLHDAGFRSLPGVKLLVDGDTYVSLKSLAEVTYHFDQATLTLGVTAPPELLPRTAIDLSPARRTDILYPHDNSIFLNYGLDYSAGGNNLAFSGMSVSNELGVRYNDLLLINDSQYSETPDNSNFVRLNTNLTWDDHATLRRMVGGDFYATSGNLGSRVQLGGLSISKQYSIDPYFILYPLFDFSGLVSLPSTVDLYVNGIRVHSENFAPGAFELRNFQGIGGAQNVEVVIRDALGREQRIAAPFYFTSQLLRRGLNEYSYNLGFMRQEFGQVSNHYADLVFSGFHRYGVTDRLSLGLRGEAKNGLLNLGGESALTVGGFGLLHFEVAGSTGEGNSGSAGLISYEYQSPRVRIHLSLQKFSGGYRTLDDTESGSRRELNLRAGIVYSTQQFGSFGVDFSRATVFNGTDQQVTNFSWSRLLWRNVYVLASMRQVRDPRTSYEAALNLSWYFDKGYSFTSSVQHENGRSSQVIEARNTIPLGEGSGWDLRGEHSGDSYLLNATAQHNARYASLRGDFTLDDSAAATTKDLRLSLYGALVHIGDTFAPTRPVRDSFSLVSVGEAEGVRVYTNGQLAGRTNIHGKAVIPDLTSYYDNQVAIEDTDIPIDYLMPRVRLFVSPPLRSGSCLNFPLRRYQAFTGTLLRDEASGEPLANAELILAAPDGPVDFWTGGDGEFYFDSQMATVDSNRYQGCDALEQGPGEFLPAGSYGVTVKLENETYQAQVTIPTSTGETVDLGKLVCRRIALGKPVAVGPATLAPPINVSPTPPSGAPPAVEAENILEKEPLPPSPVTPEVRPEPIPDRVVLQFPFDRSRPFPQEWEKLQPMVRYLQSHSGMKLEIVGYTCSRGTEAYNLRLGRRRAESVRDYLFNAGVEAGQILRVVSRGEANPLCSESTPGCQIRNRRVVMTVVAGEE